MTSRTAAGQAYAAIVAGWHDGATITDLYYQVLHILEAYEKVLQAKMDIMNLYTRMIGNDSMSEIVTAFLFSPKYVTLRAELSSAAAELH